MSSRRGPRQPDPYYNHMNDIDQLSSSTYFLEFESDDTDSRVTTDSDESGYTVQFEHTLASDSSIEALTVQQPNEASIRSSAISIRYDMPPPASQPQPTRSLMVWPVPTVYMTVPAAAPRTLDTRSDSNTEYYGNSDGLYAMTYSPTQPHP